MSRKFDIIVFGASGFTGKFCVEEIVKRQATTNEKFTWAISGRSKSKLNEILNEVSDATGKDLSNVPKVLADVSNFESLRQMAKQCSVVMNAVGPYTFWGEEVVKACIAEGTHHIDLSGEPEFLEKVQHLYHKDAEKNNSYIIGSCGFDSVPVDCGTEYLRKEFKGDLNSQFKGDLNSVQSYMEIKSPLGSKLNMGTWHSIVNGLHRIRHSNNIQKQVYPKPLPKPQYKLPQRPLHYSDVVKSWAFLLPLPDARVAARSQKYLYFNEKERPIQTNCYGISKFINSFSLLIAWIVLGILTQFKFILTIMEKYPEICTLGMFSSEGPSRVSMNNVTFTFTLVGRGWKNKLSKINEQRSTAPDTTIVLQVKGRNPGYGATCTIFLQSALTILRETKLLPSSGGVYTPGVAFRNTSLIDELNKHNVTFTIVENDKANNWKKYNLID